MCKPCCYWGLVKLDGAFRLCDFYRTYRERVMRVPASSTIGPSQPSNLLQHIAGYTLVQIQGRMPTNKPKRQPSRTESPPLLLQCLTRALGQKDTIYTNHSISFSWTFPKEAIEQRTRGGEESAKFATNTARSLRGIHRCASIEPTSKSSDNTPNSQNRR